MPSEAQLVQRYGIARRTVRRGLGLLADEGWGTPYPSGGGSSPAPCHPPPRTPADQASGAMPCLSMFARTARAPAMFISRISRSKSRGSRR
ncbi:hypothetical protein ACKI2C_33150 [Streptomyces brasiliscabiei]